MAQRIYNMDETATFVGGLGCLTKPVSKEEKTMSRFQTGNNRLTLLNTGVTRCNHPYHSQNANKYTRTGLLYKLLQNKPHGWY